MRFNEKCYVSIILNQVQQLKDSYAYHLSTKIYDQQQIATCCYINNTLANNFLHK